MSEFRAKIIAELDTNKIKGQIESLEKRIKSIDGKITLNLTGFNVETKKELNNLGNNITQTVQNSVATSANKSVNFVTKKLREGFTKEMSKVVGKRTFGLVDEKEIQKQAQSYFTTQNKVGTVTTEVFRNADSEINGFIVNVKNAEGAVERLRYGLEAIKDENGGQKIGVQYVFRGSTGNDNNIKLQEAAAKQAEKAEMALETQTQKNKAAVIQYTSALESLKTQYGDVNAAKAITKTEHIGELEKQYGVVETAITQLGSADEKTFATLRANVEAQITKLKDLATEYRNAEYAANQLAAKPIGVIKDNETQALREFEAKVKSSGITSKDFWNKINGADNDDSLASKLSKVEDKNSLREYLNLFSTIKSEFKALVAEQNGVKTKFNELLGISKQIGSLKVKISGLDANKNSNEIVALSSKLNGLIKKYRDLKAELKGNLSSEQFEKLNESVKTTESEITVLKNKVKDAQAELAKTISEKSSSNGFQKSIDIATQRYNKLLINGEGNNQLHAQLMLVNNDLQKLQSLQEAIKNSKSEEEQIANYQEFETVLSRVNNSLSSVSAQSKTFASDLQIATLDNKMQIWLEKNSRATKNFGTQIKELRNRLAELRASGGATTAQLNSLETEFKEVKLAAIGAGQVGKSFTDTFKAGFRSISNYVSISSILYQSISGLKQMYQNVVKIDTALTGLYRVTNLSASEYKNLYDEMTNSAQKYGATLSDIIDGTTTWVKLGFDANTSEKLSEITAMYQHVTDLDVNTATTNLVTAYKGFQSDLDSEYKTADKAIEYISDIYDKLGNEYAVSAADVGNAISRSASALQMAGADLAQSSAMATGITEVTQDAEKAGNSLKIVSLRVRGMKGELEDLGEEVDDDVESISKMQTHILNLTHGKVNIFNDDGTFKNIYDIMQGIAGIYKDLKSTEQADLLETIAGKHRANDIAALIQNWSQVESATNAAYNAAGTASEEQEKFAASLQGHLNNLTSAWQVISNSFLDSGVLETLIDFATNFLSTITKIVDTFGTLPTLIGVVATALSFKNIGRTKMFVLNNSSKMPIVVIVLFGYEQFRYYQC